MLRVGVLRAAKWQSLLARIVGGGLKQITRSLRAGLVRPSGLPANPLLRRRAVRYKRLAAYPHPLRPLRPHIHVRHLHRRNRHLLAAAMSSEPGWDKNLQFGFCLTKLPAAQIKKSAVVREERSVFEITSWSAPTVIVTFDPV
jgi:hypothetical protein